jgi:hypothetical protein
VVHACTPFLVIRSGRAEIAFDKVFSNFAQAFFDNFLP